jgi:acyl carrier protein
MDPFIRELEMAIVGCQKGSLRPETRFREQPWWDSLAALVIMASFQTVYGSQIGPEHLAKCQTLGDVAALAR